MSEGFDWFNNFQEELADDDDIPAKPPVKVGAIINRKGQFQKYRVIDANAGWRSIKVSRIEDKNDTMIISWDQFLKDWEERWF